MTEDVSTRINRLRPWFHTIDVGHGIRIQRDQVHGGDPEYPLPLWRRVRAWLPEDLTGLRVIDVGCNSGFFAIELKRAGAAYALGIDTVPLHLEQARLVRELSQIEIDLRLLSLYDVTEALGSFNISLCLGVLYHLKHPLLGLERLAAVTQDLLIVESAVVPESRPQKQVYGGPAWSVSFIENQSHTAEAEALLNWFVPSLSCLKAWLRTVGFHNPVGVTVVGNRALIAMRR